MALCAAFAAVAAGAGSAGPPAAPDSPLALAAALERTVVSGEGAVLPDPDIAVVLKAGSIDLSTGTWPAEFLSRSGETVSVSVSPETGCYEFSDSSGETFYTVVPAVPPTDNWDAPFRRAGDAPAPVDPLYHPSRVVMLWRLSGREEPVGALAAGAAGGRRQALRSAPPAAPTNLQFAALSLSSASNTIYFSATWPQDAPPPGGLLDLYETDSLSPMAWRRVASFPATNPPPARFALPWPALAEEPQRHVHDASCTAVTNLVVSPLDGVTPYTNVVWTCLSPGLRRSSVPSAFFRLGTRHDTDGDGLPDALETLCLGTDPASPDFGDPDAWPAGVAAGLSATPFSPAFSIANPVPDGSEIVSRAYRIDRKGAWRQYFVAASTNVLDAAAPPAWDCTGVRLAWSDDLGGSGTLATNGFSGALRIPVSTNAATLVLTLCATGGGIAAPPLFLLEYEPAVSFPGSETAAGSAADGTALIAVMHSDALVLRADRTSRPVTPGAQPSGEEALSLPFSLPSGAAVEIATDLAGCVVVRGLPCGAYPWLADAPPDVLPAPPRHGPSATPAAPRAAAPGGTDNGICGPTLFVLSPELAPLCAHSGRETAYGTPDGFPEGRDYPFEEKCLRDGFLRDDTGAPQCGGAVSPGIPGGRLDALDRGSFSGGEFFGGAVSTSVEVADGQITGRVFVGGTLFWEESVPHLSSWPQDLIGTEKLLSSEDSCDSGCGGASCATGECDGYDGPSLGSLRFRVSLGEPRPGLHSAFLYLDEAEMPASLGPASFRLRRRPGAAVSDTTSGDGVRTVACSDPRGRTLQISPSGAGAQIAISLTATGEAVCSWRVERTASGARFRRFALNGEATADETVCRSPDGAWTLSDAILGTVETLRRPESLQEGVRTEWRVLRDAAGTVLSDTYVESVRVDTPSGPVARETYRFSGSGTGPGAASSAGYFSDGIVPGRDGLPSSVHASDGRDTVVETDSSGRIALIARSRTADRLPLFGQATDAFPTNADAVVETFGYGVQPGDTASALDANAPRVSSRCLLEPGRRPVLLSREWTAIARGIAAPHGPAVRIRTERAAAPGSAPGDPGNAVSEVVRYDEEAPGVPYILRGAPIVETDEDGVETRHEYAFGAWDAAGLAFTPSGAGAFLRTRVLRTPASAPSGLPGLSTVSETVRDAALGVEVFSATRAVLAGGALSGPFGWSATGRDARGRVTSVRHHDGTFSSNEWSCCRLLATTDRTGARTLRSSSPSLARVYHAEETVSLTSLPHGEKFIPYESPGTESRATGVTQRWFDGLGRETNAIVRTDLSPGASADPDRTRPDGVGWFTTNSVAYPNGDSRLAVETSGRGVRTRRVEAVDSETGVSTAVADTYAPGVLTDALVAQHSQTLGGIPDLPVEHSVRTETRLDGSSTTREEWDGGAVWVETANDTLHAADGIRTERTIVESSDGASDCVSLMRYDMLGRLVETDAPGDRRVFAYEPGSMRVAAESNLLSGVVSVRLYDETGGGIGDAALGVTNETRTIYELDASNALWRVTRSAVFSGAQTNRWTELREQLTGLPSNVLSRSEFSSSTGETVSTTMEREVGTDIFRETSVSSATGTTVRRIQYGCTIEETTSEGTTYHYFDAFGRSFTTDHADPGETTKRHRTWTGRDRFGDIVEEDEFRRAGATGAAVFATFFARDHFGHVVSSTNAVGDATVFSRDFRGNVTAESGATWPTHQAYDSASRRTGLSTTRDGAAWDATSWAYDAATGLCTNKTYADGSCVSRTWTTDGLPLRTTQPSGRWTENVYDARRDLVAILSGDPSVAAAYERDVFGRETAVSNAVAATLLFRDARGNVTNETTTIGADTFSLDRAFDESGRLSRVGGTWYGYAEDGRLDTVSNALFCATYAYAPDRADAGCTVALANGTEITRFVQRDAYRRRLATNIVTSVNDTIVESLAYAYDALGRPVSRNDDTFAYNNRSEVVFSRRGAESAED
ncbi:MAG: hypothetical protein IJ783_06350, partial [Kiritimatiellae bacterium]|nr:hypothetical protein [Kiritimatiellia bacterium]